jgi:hypothetical protein
MLFNFWQKYVNKTFYPKVLGVGWVYGDNCLAFPINIEL